VGATVEARFGAGAAYYPGVVRRVCPGGGAFDVAYDDGDEESGVPRALIRPLGAPHAAARAAREEDPKKKRKPPPPPKPQPPHVAKAGATADAAGGPPPKKKSRLILDPLQTITVRQENPKRDGSGARRRFEQYKAATSAAEFLALGGTRADFVFDVAHGFVTLL
jgi:hypothetical protein